ncbi:hypothetical protein F5Y10DRAFT_228146 [Nemania abortiva]|nr:hypothetical protein F5Y10DRAFT_228146 [Nemania abortiva]
MYAAMSIVSLVVSPLTVSICAPRLMLRCNPKPLTNHHISTAPEDHGCSITDVILEGRAVETLCMRWYSNGSNGCQGSLVGVVLRGHKCALSP